MKHYTHLTLEQRYQISALHKEKTSQTRIAKILGVHKSTVCRELRRNKGAHAYFPAQAHRIALQRRKDKAPRRIPRQTWLLVEEKLRLQWSPEQIAGWLKAQGAPGVSHERIYQHVAQDRERNGTLHKNLRHGKKRRSRYGSYRRKGPVANRVSIEQRPAVVETRERTGDWEIDTVIGKTPQTLLTIVERRSRMTCIAKLPRRGAEELLAAAVEILGPFAEKVLTITSDNGSEFARHELIAHTLKASFFFSHPYRAWERGLNENTNGLIRQYLPKKSSFEELTDEEIQTLMHKLNNRPRKALGFKTPNEVFFESPPVALQG